MTTITSLPYDKQVRIVCPLCSSVYAGKFGDRLTWREIHRHQGLNTAKFVITFVPREVVEPDEDERVCPPVDDMTGELIPLE